MMARSDPSSNLPQSTITREINPGINPNMCGHFGCIFKTATATENATCNVERGLLLWNMKMRVPESTPLF
jgi:hypothetical protein